MNTEQLSNIRSIYEQIRLIYIESKDTTNVPINKKYQIYRECNLLINRAESMIDQTVMMIRSIKTNNINPEYIGKIDEYLDLLDKGLNISETFEIVQWLMSVQQDLPTRAQIIDVLDSQNEFRDDSQSDSKNELNNDISSQLSLN